MAHFAQLNDNNEVTNVIVVSNDVATTEELGLAFLIDWSGYTNWKQCSYNGTIRKQFPSIGFTYNPIADVFISIQPYPSWTLDENFDWQPPIAKPTDTTMFYVWNEADLTWLAKQKQY